MTFIKGNYLIKKHCLIDCYKANIQKTFKNFVMKKSKQNKTNLLENSLNVSN